MLLSLPLVKEDIALRFCRRDLGMLVQLLTGYNFLNCYLTLRSFHYSLYVRCILSWGRALGPLGGLSTGQLNCCLPRMEEKRRDRDNILQVLIRTRKQHYVLKQNQKYLQYFTECWFLLVLACYWLLIGCWTGQLNLAQLVWRLARAPSLTWILLTMSLSLLNC